MMVRREVFEKFRDDYPQFSYKPDHNRSENFDGSRYIHSFLIQLLTLMFCLVKGQMEVTAICQKIICSVNSFVSWVSRLGSVLG